jgi:hypothetical protein
LGSSPNKIQWPPWRRRKVSPIQAPNENQISQCDSSLRSSSSLSPILAEQPGVEGQELDRHRQGDFAPASPLDVGDVGDHLALRIDQLLEIDLGLPADLRRERVGALAQLGHRFLEPGLGRLLGGGELLGALGGLLRRWLVRFRHGCREYPSARRWQPG